MGRPTRDVSRASDARGEDAPATPTNGQWSESEEPDVAATDGRVPGQRGMATRRRLLLATVELLSSTPWRSVKVIDIARSAGTAPATFYQYFENVEQSIGVLAEE